MSIECSECEHDLRGLHDPLCSRARCKVCGELHYYLDHEDETYEVHCKCTERS